MHSILIKNAIKYPQWYAVEVSEPLVSGQAKTLPDCVRQLINKKLMRLHIKHNNKNKLH